MWKFFSLLVNLGEWVYEDSLYCSLYLLCEFNFFIPPKYFWKQQNPELSVHIQLLWCYREGSGRMEESMETRPSRTWMWNQLDSPSSTGPCLGGRERGKYVCFVCVCVCVCVCACMPVCMHVCALGEALSFKIWHLSKMIWLFPGSWWGPSWVWSSQGPSLE